MTRKKFNSRKSVFYGKRYNNEKVPLNVANLTFADTNRPIIPYGTNDEIETDKVTTNQKYYDNFKNESIIFDLIDMKAIGRIFRKLRCGECKKKSLKLEVRKRNGLAVYFQLECSKCNHKIKFSNSKSRVYSANEKEYSLEPINLSFVTATRLAGIGNSASKRLCTFLNLNNPPSTWIDYQNILLEAFRKRAEWSMERGLGEGVLDTGSKDLSASFDGSWMKKGFDSLIGLVSCINLNTNKVIGIDVESKYCPVCKGKENCKNGENCSISYRGSSGGMEPVGATKIIKSLYDKYNIRIVNYLGDGDSRAFAKANAAMPYKMNKLECTNHMSKRIGAQLRKLKREKKTVLINGKRGIAGSKRLTDKAIDKIQSYYHWIICNNIGNPIEMRRQILAMYKHIASTDSQPDHDDCNPEFCKYLQAVENGEDYRHGDHFHIDPIIMKETKGVFDNLSKLELLEKCAHGKTSNANECFNSTVWNLLSKNGFANKELAELVVYMAVCLYNEGQLPILDVFASLGLPIGENMILECQSMDKLRVTKKKRQELKKGNKRKREDDITNADDYQPGLC